MEIFNTLPPLISNGKVLRVEIGMHWTAVLVETEGGQACGLASTFSRPDHEHARQSAVRDAGKLENHSTRQLAELFF